VVLASLSFSWPTPFTCIYVEQLRLKAFVSSDDYVKISEKIAEKSGSKNVP